MKKYISILIFPVLFFSCVTPKKTNYLQEPGKGVASYQKFVDTTAYKLQEGDQLYVKISSLDEATNRLFNSTSSSQQSLDLLSYTIYPDGSIDYPFLEPVKLIGLTTRQAKDTLKAKLQVVAPDCDVDIRLANGFFTVVGNAGNGRYPIPKERLTIFQALALSKDLNPFSDRTKVHLLRPTPEGTQVTTFDVRSKEIIGSEYYYIQPNDVIYVQSFKGQFWGFSSFAAMLTAAVSTFTLGYLVYDTFIK
jgi:polysaccharide export outer membrane protein